MFSDIASSIRWDQAGVAIGFMGVVLIAHFLFGRPLQRKAQAEVQKDRLDLQTMELATSISSITAGLICDLREQVNAEQLAVQTAKLQAAMRQVAGPPALLQAMQELLDATAKLAAASRADKHALDSKALRVTTACLAVELRLPALVRSAAGDT